MGVPSEWTMYQLLTMDKANHYGSSMNLPIEASKADYQDRVAAFAYTGV